MGGLSLAKVTGTRINLAVRSKTSVGNVAAQSSEWAAPNTSQLTSKQREGDGDGEGVGGGVGGMEWDGMEDIGL